MKPLRFAVIGSRRGRTFIQAVRALNTENVSLVAVCDPYEETLRQWADTPGIRLYSDYEQVLNDPDIDAVCIATPIRLHARQAIAALEAGKHVLCEVTAAYTLQECRDLIAAVERTGMTYMMAENYCFMEPVLQVQQMVEQGVFGTLTFASGAYIHDCRKLLFHDDGELTWRGHLRREVKSNGYPTHSLGPVARWLDINRSDFLATTATWQSRPAAPAHYAKSTFPERADYAAGDFWRMPDAVTTLIRTTNEALIELHVDWASARPHQMCRYELQGTRASFCWPDGPGKPEPLIWIEGRSPAGPHGEALDWEPLSKYRDEFQHPLWREHGAAAQKAGHGGGDFFVLREFVAAIREERAPMIDVYDAVTWSSIIPLSEVSIAEGNTPVQVPRFASTRP